MAAETLLAALGLLLCLALLVRMALGRRHRARLDAKAQQTWRTLQGLHRRASALWQRRQQRHQQRVQGRTEREAGQAAQALIERARRTRPLADREGNVYRPRSFQAGTGDDPPDGRHRKDH